MKPYRLLLCLLLALSLLLCGCGDVPPDPSDPSEPPKLEAGADPFATCESVPTDPERADASFGALTVKTAVQNGITEEDGVYTVTKGGDYTLSGTLEGALRIEVSKTEKVKLILAGLSLTSRTHAPISLVSADELTVKAEGGTYNVIYDARAASALGQEDAAIYAKDDLTLSGSGTLIVRSDFGMGVRSSNDVTVKNVTAKIIAFDTALRGGDSVTVESGALCLISRTEDGIKTANTDISQKGKQRGLVEILSGRVDIFSAADGIQAAYSYKQTAGATVTVRAGSYGADPYDTAAAVTPAASAKGIKCEHELDIAGGMLFVMATEDALQANGGTVHENGKTGTGTLHVQGSAQVFCASHATALQADGALTLASGAYLVTEPLGEDAEPIKVTGTLTLTGATVLVLGTSDALTAPTLSLTDLTLPAGTYTLGGAEEVLAVFTVHETTEELTLLSGGTLPSGEYTLKDRDGVTVHTVAVGGVD